MKSRLYRNLQAMQPYLVHQILVFRHKSFSYIACRLWNNLPSHVREAPDLKNFVAKLRECNTFGFVHYQETYKWLFRSQ